MKKKRVLSLLMSMLMLFSTAFMTTSCEKTKEEAEQVEADAAKKTVTLNMFIVTDDETTEEQAKAVQLAINAVTLQKFKTKVKINYCKSDEMYDMIDATLLEIDAIENPVEEEEASEETEGETEELTGEESEAEEAAEEGAEEAAEDEEKAEDEEAEEGEEEEEEEVTLDTELDKLYADGDIFLEGPQVDIIVFDSYVRFRDYANRQLLAPLDSYLNLDSKILRTYIFPSYLEAATLGTKSTYGIPTNGAIGAYEYFVFDKELCDKYGFDASSVKEFGDIEPFLAAVKAGEPDVIPLNKATSPRDYEFLDADGSPMGVLRTQKDKDWPQKVLSLYDEEGFVEHYRKIYEYRMQGYLAPKDAPSNARYAVQILEGTKEAPKFWEERDGREYICVEYKTPKLTNKAALNGVFTICAKSYNKDRSMELIREFNTSPKLANLLQWGIEDVHYYVDDANDGKGTISLVENSGYYMDNNLTGNKYIKYRLSGTPDEFEAQKEQNLNSWMGGLVGFNPILAEEDEAVMTSSAAVANKYYPALISGEAEDFDMLIESLRAELNSTYSVGTFEKFISHKIGGSYNTYRDSMNEQYPDGGTSADEVSEVEEYDENGNLIVKEEEEEETSEEESESEGEAEEAEAEEAEAEEAEAEETDAGSEDEAEVTEEADAE